MPDRLPVRLLYIGEDPDLARYLQQFLDRQSGYDTVLTTNARMGSAMLQTRSFDLILADYEPGLCNDDSPLGRQLVDPKAGPPVILLFPTGSEQLVMQTDCGKISDYVVKDDQLGYQTLLSAVIGRVLNQQRLLTEHEQALETLKQRNRDLTLLTRVGQELTATLDFNQVIERLLQAVTETVGVEGSTVWLWQDEAGGTLVCQAVYHRGLGQELVNLTMPSGQGVVGWVAQNRTSAVVNTTATDERFTSAIDTKIDFQTTDLLAVPLIVREAVIGVLEVVNKVDGHFNDQDRALLETLAASAAIAIDNARLVERLRQQQTELERQNEDLDAFAHTVAHDIKNPLGLMTGTAQILESDFADLSEDELRYHLGVIARNGRRASSLIGELLLLAELRLADVHVETIPMDYVLAEVQRRLADMIETYNPQIILPEDWPLARGYEPWVEQIWVNYLSNAFKYGGRPPRVELGGSVQEDGMVRFWIKDNGRGLSPEEQARLFTPFTRFNHVRATGYGLGLSIVRRIAEKLGGTVGVKSSGVPGEGSEFSFTLPAAARPADRSSTAAEG